MIALLIIVIISNVFDGSAEGSCNVEGFYWRDYNGEIPVDAVPGGRDINGKPIYIGQVFNSKILVPAKIYTTDRKAYYELNGSEHGVSDNIKILCSQHPEHFEWIRTNNDDIKLLTDKHLVLGGYEPGSTTYIGRVQSGGEILVGKTLADIWSWNAGLHVTKDGRGIKHTSFEVLAFNRNAYNTGNQNPDSRKISAETGNAACKQITINLFN